MLNTDAILERLPEFETAARDLRDILLANLVFLGEIPAPTFDEQRRAEMLIQRFSECGLLNCSLDEMGNGVGVMPGKGQSEPYIALAAHLDTLHAAEIDHSITLEANTVTGCGVSDNSLGLAVLATLPTFFERLDIRPRSNLLLIGDAKSLGRGNLRGIGFFLENNSLPIEAALCLEGVQLERMNYASNGMLRGEIRVQISEAHQWSKYGVPNAIELLHEVIGRILEIPVPTRPETNINLGAIRGGSSFNLLPMEASLRFEINSESTGVAPQLGEQIEEICLELSSKTGAIIHMDVVATRRTGGLSFRHPLPRMVRRTHQALGIRSHVTPSASELASFIHSKIPAVTVGVTNGKKVEPHKETLEIDPMFKGLAQVAALVLALDGGLCEED